MFEVNLNQELAKVWNSIPPSGNEWHTGLVVSYLTNSTEAFDHNDLEPLQTVTDWHDLPKDKQTEWRIYYPCFYTKYTSGRN